MIALRVAEQQILRLTTCPPNDILEAKAAAHESVQVIAYNSQTTYDELFEVWNLRHEKDGYGVDHLTGYIIQEVRSCRGRPRRLCFVRVVFVDSELEANPLSLK